MIGYLKGIISHVFTNFCFINVGGVGYRVYVTVPTREKLVKNQEATLLTYLMVREDLLQLYGFLTQEEYETFMHLVSVSGIGAKVALGVLSSVSPEEFRLAIGGNDLKRLTQIPGIGKKTAERLVLELKDKIGTLVSTAHEAVGITSKNLNIEDEAILALVSLGYHSSEIEPLVRGHVDSTQSVEDLIRYVLKEITSKR